MLCGLTCVRSLFGEGREVVRDGQLVILDMGALIERQTRLARKLAG